ncbi:uncharacterized protein LOC134286131 [Aedes albopictus]|uniref:PHD-type domain-containing protein n=1 Tax=Aedes albopictus TaxID=7160 RepID=A0ABM1XW43_AEDAL
MTNPGGDADLRHGNCSACDNPDADRNYVQCDTCDSWWHFSCVNVTESISDRSWICHNCVGSPQQNQHVATGNTSPNGSTTSMQRDLALLKQRQELERQRMEHELQKKFLDEQLELMDKAIASRSRESGRESGGLVADVPNGNPEQESGAVGGDPNSPAAAQPADNRNLVDAVHGLERQLERCQLQAVPGREEIEDLRRQLQQCKRQLGLDPTEWSISPPIGQHRYSFPNPSGDQYQGNQQPRNLGANKKTYSTEVGIAGKSSFNESGSLNKVYGGNVPHKSSTIPYDTIPLTRDQQWYRTNSFR